MKKKDVLRDLRSLFLAMYEHYEQLPESEKATYRERLHGVKISMDFIKEMH